MSRYEWEQGTLLIPATEQTALKKRLREGWNALLERRLALALELYAHLKAAAKGKRNFDYAKAAEAWAAAKNPSTSRGHFGFSTVSRDSDAATDAIRLVLGDVYASSAGPRVKPHSPKKKDLPWATTKTLAFTDTPLIAWDGSIHLTDGGRKLTWRVQENNHACDHAWNHPMGAILAQALAKIQWTRGSGGTIVGNDEYNRDSRDEHSGGNYAKRRFGPKGRADGIF